MKKYSWEEIRLESYTIEDAKIVTSLFRDSDIHTKVETCRYLDLEQVRKNGGDILANLSHDTRYSIQRTLKAFDNDVKIEWAESTLHAHEILTDLAGLFQQTWTQYGQRGIFASNKYVQFHKEIISKLINSRSVILFRATNKNMEHWGVYIYLYMIMLHMGIR